MRKFSTGAARLANRRGDECVRVVLIGENNCWKSISFDARLLVLLPFSGACGRCPWLHRRTSPGWVRNSWPLVPSSTKGRSEVKSQRAQPQECEAKRRRLSEWAAGCSGPLGIAEDCVRVLCDNVCVCVCAGWGRRKGQWGFDLGLCLTWDAP